MRGRTLNVTHPPTREWDSAYHAPVLVGPIVELFAGASLVLDGTLGGGGHSAALLDAGVRRVIGIDRDAEALAAATGRLHAAVEQGRFTAMRGNYAALDTLS